MVHDLSALGAGLKRRVVRIFLLAVAAVAIGVAVPLEARASDHEPALWQALRSGDHIALMRHALAPGTGDPADFVLGSCATQRNLSQAGRDQARRAGDRFRSNGIDRADIYFSEWCRCRDTASLLDLGPVIDLPALNSFFQRPESRQPQLQALRDWLRNRAFQNPPVLVTHQVMITALTGVYPRSGEIVVVRLSESGDVTVAGTVRMN